MKKELVIPLLLLLLACGNNSENLFSGSIEIDEVRISARVSGTVEELAVVEGDQIREGQTLLKIDETEYALGLTRAEAALTMAEAGLQTILEGTRQQQIVSASSAVAAARTARDQALTDRQRARELADAGAISDQNLQAAETRAILAETQYTTARQNYSLAVEGARSTEIEAAEAAVESAEASRQLAMQRLEWTDVVSPLAGIVISANIEAGENITPGMTLLTVADMDTVKAIFYISQPYLASVRTGGSVTVSTEGTDSVSGRITHVADSAEFTPS